MDVIFHQKANVGLSSEEPDEFSHNTLPVNFFGREEWKTF